MVSQNSDFKELFVFKSNNYNIRSKYELAIPLVNTVLKGKNSIRYLGPIIWNSIPLNIRCVDSINIFKSKIRQWKPESCKCRLCLNYVSETGFVEIS